MIRNIKRIIAKGLRICLNPPALTKCDIHNSSFVCEGTQATLVKMDKNSYIGCFCFAINVDIGAFCSIADNCRIGGAEHPLKRVSTSPVFHSGHNVIKKNYVNFEPVESKRTYIGNDVWIGANVCIKSGVNIANGAVIGMGSVVVHDIGPYEIWAGTPARLIRKRFDDNTIQKLLDLEWWAWNDVNLEKYAPYFDDPERLLSVIEENKLEK